MSEIYLWISRCFDGIHFELYDWGHMFGVFFHTLFHNSALKFWPIPPDRAGGAESGLEVAFLPHASLDLPTDSR